MVTMLYIGCLPAYVDEVIQSQLSCVMTEWIYRWIELVEIQPAVPFAFLVFSVSFKTAVPHNSVSVHTSPPVNILG